jgi:hypothetical protein
MPHVLEDIATIKEGYSKTKCYPFLARIEEEGLCEYMAFTQQIKSRFPLTIPSSILRNAFPSFSIPLSFPRTLTKKTMDPINLIIVSELYYYWNRANNPLYWPRIYPNVGVKVGPLWQSFWRCHRNEWNVIKIPGVKTSEVHDRLFLTYH